MTMKEADEAAVKRLPVIYDGGADGTPKEYERITRTGYLYDEKGQRRGFLELLDKCKNSVTYARPEAVTLKE